MENELNKNLVYLVKHLTNLENVLVQLIQDGTISKDEREEILSKSTSSDKNTCLLMLIQQKDVLRSRFLGIMRNTSNGHCADQIEKNSAEFQPMTNWKYETNRILGYGSFGVVISAKDTLDNQNYAVKIIPDSQFDSSKKEENDKLLRESRNQASLHHPNVVKYFYSDIYSLSVEKIKEILQWESSGGKQIEELIQLRLKNHFDEQTTHGSRITGLFIKTEICGETLRQWLNNQVEGERALDTRVCEEISQGIVDGLNYIHSKSIIHRDLRPENVFFSNRNFLHPVKIGDFGLSNQIEVYTTQTLTLQVGNHQYRAPETNVMHKAGSAKYSHAVDLYSCGLTLSEIFDPVPIKRLTTKFETIVYYRDTGNRIKEIIPWVNELILKLTEEEPTNRFDRGADGKPLPIKFPNVSTEIVKVHLPTESLDRDDESLSTPNKRQKLLPETISPHEEILEQGGNGREVLPSNVDGETRTKETYSEMRLAEDLNEMKEELMKLVEERNISEIVRILSVTPIPKYQLQVAFDRIDLKFERETKKMGLSLCSLNLDSVNRISTEELRLWNVSFLRNGEKLEEVTVNEVVDIHKIKKLTIDCPYKSNMSLDLGDESVSLDYLYLLGAKVLNWKEAKWSVEELRLIVWYMQSR